jgi:hypothetical protein
MKKIEETRVLDQRETRDTVADEYSKIRNTRKSRENLGSERVERWSYVKKSGVK